MSTYYDWSEYQIRDLVFFNHVPEEMSIRNGDGVVAVQGPVCKQCYGPWPCHLILEMREWKRANMPPSSRASSDQ